MGDCCLKGFRWNGKPAGRETILAGMSCYTVGTNSSVAILLLHDLFGWTFPNTRLLSDHLAEEVGCTVYVPDLRNTKAIRETDIFNCAKALRGEHKYSSIGAIGFCFGGWAVFRLGAKDVRLVDCISTAHPTFLEQKEISDIGVPVQIMAPEHDQQFTEELKAFSNTVIPKLGVPYDYQYFPFLTHGFATRGNPNDKDEIAGMERAKNAAVLWFRQWLHKTSTAN
ncbi:unnamed protein product [Aspergillus oryzae]|uniref:Unnamed protein product n=1 Tax=Aspergillus oryzae TaxID=5062 RepID=A0AAN5BWK8_ASPOZ|nr:unnamed protein product [Aspergillus oryzae]GMF91718.1 unnamed protein product [Aspergillus oryzae]GMG36441.1 unnamed protein product [Aspergillus oryzae]